MSVIGIDPSLAATGLCWGPGEGETVKLGAKDPERLVKLHDAVAHRVEGVIASVEERLGFVLQPRSLAVIEDLPTHAHSAGLTGQAQGVVRLVLQECGVPFITVAPASLKLFAAGSGRADKAAMAKALPFPLPRGWDDNTVDAYWLYRMGRAYLDRYHRPRDHHFGKARTCKWSEISFGEAVAA